MKFILLILKFLCSFYYEPACQELHSRLSQASRENDVAAIKLLIESGVNPDTQNGEALIMASTRGHLEIAKLLLEYGANPNMQEGEALIRPSSDGNTKIVELLLAHGANPNAQDGEALIKASIHDTTEIVELLLTHGANPNAQDGKALIMASIHGTTEIVELLLAHGANPNMQDGEALVKACMYGKTEAVKLLLAHGANPTMQDGEALIKPSIDGNIEIIELLLAHGINQNAQNGKALVKACMYGKTEAVKLLLAHGANPTMQDGEALVMASVYGNTESFNLLMGSVIIPNSNIKREVHQAGENRDIEIFRFLFQPKIDLNAPTEETLIKACTRGYTETTRLRIESSSHFSIPQKAALVEACARRDIEIFALLLGTDTKKDMRWFSARALLYTEVLEWFARSIGKAISFEEIALRYILAGQFYAFLEMIEIGKIDFSENQILLREILFSGNYDLVKYAFENVPELQDAYIVGLSNYNFEYTEGTRNILHNYIKTGKNNYVVQLSLPIALDEAIISHFSGLINPGGFDTYPTHENPFLLDDMDQELMQAHEKLYQKVVEAAQKYDIPYLGICAGAQHLVLNAAGSLIQKGHKSITAITFFGGTLPHYLFLTEEERATALVNCEFPEVIIDNAYASHSYSAVSGMLGEDILLGAISSEGIPEAFSLGANKIGVQFHPEHYHPDHIEYVNKPSLPELNRQKIFLENVFEMFEGYYKSMQYAKRAGLDRLEAKAAIAYANEKLVKTLQSCQATKLTPAQEALWAGVGSVEAQPAEHLYVLPGITPEDFAYTQDQNHLILYSTAKNGVLSARDFFADNSTRTIYIHFADGSVFHLHSDDGTAFEEGKSQWVE